MERCAESPQPGSAGLGASTQLEIHFIWWQAGVGGSWAIAWAPGTLIGLTDPRRRREVVENRDCQVGFTLSGFVSGQLEVQVQNLLNATATPIDLIKIISIMKRLFDKKRHYIAPALKTDNYSSLSGKRDTQKTSGWNLIIMTWLSTKIDNDINSLLCIGNGWLKVYKCVLWRGNREIIGIKTYPQIYWQLANEQ